MRFHLWHFIMPSFGPNKVFHIVSRVFGRFRPRLMLPIEPRGVTVTWPISKKMTILDFLKFGQMCLGWFWLIERLSLLAQIDVLMALGLYIIDKSWSGTNQTTFLSTKTISDTSDRISKNPKFSFFLKSHKWLWPPEAQLATSTHDLFDQNCRVVYGSACLRPNLGSLTWKTNGAFSRCLIDPIIILGQGKRVCWLVGGKCVNRKLSQINFDQH